MKEQNSFIKGLIDGLPICFGYLSVAVAFEIFAVENGLTALEAAYNLIKSTDRSTGDITRSVGYEDTLYFSKVFHRTYGFSPTVAHEGK